MNKMILAGTAIAIGLISAPAAAQLGGALGSSAGGALGTGVGSIGSSATGAGSLGASSHIDPDSGNSRVGVAGRGSTRSTLDTPDASLGSTVGGSANARVTATTPATAGQVKATTRSAAADVKRAKRKSRRDAEKALASTPTIKGSAAARTTAGASATTGD